VPARFQVFPTIDAALKFSPVGRPLGALLAKEPGMAKAAADPTTNVTLFVPTSKVRALPLPRRRRRR
jgi:hypothetical protein